MEQKSRLWYLQNINLFEGLTMEQMERLAKIITELYPTKNQYVYLAQDPSKSIYFLKEGRVKIGEFSEDGKETIKAILHPGEIFGELALAGESKRSDFAQALDQNTRICALSSHEMENLMKENSSMGIKVTKMMGFRLQKTERKLHSLIFKDARTRVIDFIRDLAIERGKKVGDETLIKHNLTHKEMANLTATSRQTVTTVFNDLKEKNLINFERKRILVRNLQQLK